MPDSAAQRPPTSPSPSATAFFAILRSVKDHYTTKRDDDATGTWRGEVRALLLACDSVLGHDPVLNDAKVRYVGFSKGHAILMTLLSLKDPIAGPRDTLRYIRQDAMHNAALAALVGVLEPRIARVIAPILNERLSRPDYVELVRDAFRDLFSPGLLPSLLAVINDMTDPDNLPVMQDLSRVAAESVAEDTLPQISKLITGVVCAAVSDGNPSAMAEELADPCVIWARGVAQTWTAHEDPDEWLDMAQAADYLGIRPKTLHVHIRNHAGKSSELPVERRTGPGYRGHGKYFVRMADLTEWATTYWKSPRKQALTTAPTA